MGLIVAGESPIADMADHTHHRDGVGAQIDPEVLPDGLLPAERLPRHHVIDDHHGLTGHAVLVVEEPAFEQPQSHYLQIFRRHAAGQNERLFVRRWSGRRGPVADLVVTFAHRDGIDHGDGFDSGHAADAIQNILPDSADLPRMGESHGRKRHPGGEHISSVYAWVKRRKTEHGAPQHSGGNQQHHRQRDLGNHKAAVQSP